MQRMSKHLINPEIQAMAIMALAGLQAKEAQDRSKQAFVPAGDPSMDPSAAGGGAPPGGAPPGGDPSAGGGAPPPGGDPSAGGGAPPPPPVDPTAIAQQVMQMIQAQGGAGGGMGGGAEPIKPKIDVNVTMLQILKMLSRIADALGVQIPASEMVATQGDLTQFGMAQQSGAGTGGGAPPPGGAAGGGQSAIPPIQPIQPAAPGMGAPKAAHEIGEAFEGGYDTGGLDTLSSKAAAITNFWSASRKAS
jgi:hypothetical protein